MSFDPQEWIRLLWETTPIYVRPNPPCWFIPNEAGDRLLQEARNQPSMLLEDKASRFEERLPEASPAQELDNLDPREPQSLKEFWFHLTNRCNLSCRHCLFSSSPHQTQELPKTVVLQTVRQAHALGCRVFAFTGGEPFVYREFPEIVQEIFRLADSHVVVLTNGLIARSVLEKHNWNPERLHLQVSLDGLEKSHDFVRGQGTFSKTVRELRALSRMGVPFTLSMCPVRSNVHDVPHMPDLAKDVGASNIHFMWYFVRGRGVAQEFVPVNELFDVVRLAVERAEKLAVSVDNVRSLASQVFAPPGTRHVAAGMAWESLALGPDGQLYPSAALLGVPELAVAWHDDLNRAWKESPVFRDIRYQTAASTNHPLRYLVGAGDPDHSYLASGTFVGADPYMNLYEKMALWLMGRRASRTNLTDRPALRLKMGDILENCGHAPNGVAFTHSNCLLAVASPSSLSVVRDFYKDAAVRPKLEILNPVGYPLEMMTHIPEEYRFRGYGCGSPVVDAALRPGETVVDLGCGGGVECFIASKQVGPRGRVIGIDMLEGMLKRSVAGAHVVAKRLGYDNMAFLLGLLESLPLKDESVDVVLSNCVLNLSTDKRRAFEEMHRILRPGGRLVVSDVVCDTDPGPVIRNDPVLHGECLGGAFTQRDLVGLLEESGFKALRFVKRFPYRTVAGHRFYSLTFEAHKEGPADTVSVLYPGPFAAVQTFSGTRLIAGSMRHLSRWEAEIVNDQVWVLDEAGTVTNREGESCCTCLPPETSPGIGTEQGQAFKVSASSFGLESGAKARSIPLRRRSGCMVCGEPLTYDAAETLQTCVYCQGRFPASSRCAKGHFVCDVCHSRDALKVMEHLCLSADETDLIALMDRIRRHPVMPVHGPEHHALVPAVIVTAYRNAGGAISDDQIRTALRRGSQIPGGSCGFMGCCGAAVGVGIAFSILLAANPVKGRERCMAQQATQAALAEISSLNAARCCQRDVWISLKKAAEISSQFLDRPLVADHTLKCRQQAKNRECVGLQCPVLRSLNGQASQGGSA